MINKSQGPSLLGRVGKQILFKPLGKISEKLTNKIPVSFVNLGAAAWDARPSLPATIPVNLLKPVAFSNLVERGGFKVVILDRDGVLMEGKNAIEGTVQAVARLKKRGILTPIVSNVASSPQAKVAKKLREAGFGFTDEEVITVGLTMQESLTKLGLGKDENVVILGPEGTFELIREVGVNPVLPHDLKDAKPKAVILASTKGYDWKEELTVLTNIIRDNPDIPLFLGNAVFVQSAGQGKIKPGPRSLASIVERLTQRRFEMLGKPSPAIFQYAIRVAREKIPGLKDSEVLVVGDELRADIVGGNRAGYRTVLALSGITPKSNYLKAITESGICPYAVIDSILE